MRKSQRRDLIVITGPESSGKTNLGMRLAVDLNWEWVPEYARDYLTRIGRPYVESDLLEIARGQYALIEEALESVRNTSNKKVIADTDLLTIVIWSMVKYRRVDPEIIELYRSQLPTLYLLAYPDIPWEYDPLRESPNDRLDLFEVYVEAIESWGIPYEVIRGMGNYRVDRAIRSLSRHFLLP